VTNNPRRLSARLSGTPDGPYDGVPDHLKLPLTHWVQGIFGYRSSGGMRETLIMNVASRCRIPLTDSVYGGADWQDQMLSYCHDSSETFLDVVDACLRYADNPAVSALTETLATGGSTWTVANNGKELLRRVDETAEAAFDQTVSMSDQASDELRQAWSRLYGRSPDSSDAWDHAIKAVEVVSIPIVVPSQQKPTLGHVIGEIKTNSTRWQLILGSADQADTENAILGMLQAIWPNPDRHGNRHARSPSREETEGAVSIAIALVSIFRRSLIGPTRTP
jgi:hypothetical protein